MDNAHKILFLYIECLQCIRIALYCQQQYLCKSSKRDFFLQKNTNMKNKTYEQIAFIIGLIRVAGGKPLGEIFLGYSLPVHLNNKMLIKLFKAWEPRER